MLALISQHLSSVKSKTLNVFERLFFVKFSYYYDHILPVIISVVFQIMAKYIDLAMMTWDLAISLACGYFLAFAAL